MPHLFLLNGQGASAPKSANASRIGLRLRCDTGFLIALTIARLCGSPAFAQRGAHAAQAGLDTLVHRSATIVRGSVTSAVVEPHPQFPNIETVVVTVAVVKVLKGSAPATYTFRQVLLDPRDTADGGGYRKAGQLLLLLNPVSAYGLTSPVGMEQGRFRIQRDAKGKAFAVNGRGNVGLFHEVGERVSDRGIAFSRQAQEMMRKTSGQASLDSLEDAISTLVGAD
jgi:hypothetical protein